jgi:integrase
MKWPTLETIQTALQAVARPEWRSLFAVCLETASRYGEIAALTWDQVDAGLARIEPHTLPDGSSWRPKSPSGIRAVTSETLASLPRSEGLVFFPGRERPPHNRTANYFLDRACQRACVERFTTHALRHARITHALAAGADPNSVRAAVGHRSLKTTVNYMYNVPVIGSLPPLEAPQVVDPAVAQYLPLVRRTWR